MEKQRKFLSFKERLRRAAGVSDGAHYRRAKSNWLSTGGESAVKKAVLFDEKGI